LEEYPTSLLAVLGNWKWKSGERGGVEIAPETLSIRWISEQEDIK